MKWDLPWKRKADDVRDKRKDEDRDPVSATNGLLESSPFVEPFRPLYDIRDERLNDAYSNRPLYTPSSASTRRGSTNRISVQPSYPFKQRSTRSGYDRAAYYRRDRSPFSSRFEEEERMSLLPFQWLGAILLVGILYLGSHGTGPWAERIQKLAAYGMHVDYNVSNITAWFQQHLNGATDKSVPASAPADGKSVAPPGDVTTTVSQPTVSQHTLYASPLPNGKVTSDYKAETQQEMILTAAPGSAVQAIADGTVAAVGNNAQQGTYVLLDHGTLGKTLYGHLGDVTVKVNDKVKAKQPIGHLEKNGQSADMYFGYIVNGKYENPHSIISF
jgi:murein DD-endopeptidase MepM/ murein hydrolase activator NlpD